MRETIPARRRREQVGIKQAKALILLKIWDEPRSYPHSQQLDFIQWSSLTSPPARSSAIMLVAVVIAASSKRIWVHYESSAVKDGKYFGWYARNWRACAEGWTDCSKIENSDISAVVCVRPQHDEGRNRIIQRRCNQAHPRSRFLCSTALMKVGTTLNYDKATDNLISFQFQKFHQRVYKTSTLILWQSDQQTSGMRSLV